MLIYMLEDDQVIRDLVLYALRQQTDLEAQGFERPSAFYAAVRSRVPDLILLDVMLPEEDGLTVLKNLRLRRETKLTPVIILSAKGTGYDKICGLDGGADDYIPKPFEIMELLSRVKAWERRLSLTAQEASGEEQPREYRIGGLTVSPVYQLSACPPGSGLHPGTDFQPGVGVWLRTGEPNPGRTYPDPAGEAGGVRESDRNHPGRGL